MFFCCSLSSFFVPWAFPRVLQRFRWCSFERLFIVISLRSDYLGYLSLYLLVKIWFVGLFCSLAFFFLSDCVPTVCKAQLVCCGHCYSEVISSNLRHVLVFFCKWPRNTCGTPEEQLRKPNEPALTPISQMIFR